MLLLTAQTAPLVVSLYQTLVQEMIQKNVSVYAEEEESEKEDFIKKEKEKVRIVIEHHFLLDIFKDKIKNYNREQFAIKTADLDNPTPPPKIS